MNYGIYQKLRNASWQCLLDCKISALPIPISSICELYGGKVVNDSDVHMLKNGESGRIYVINGDPIVVVNDSELFQRIRFTIAHEVGHYLLGHLGNNKSALNREYENIKPIQETEADSFATRLLAPACVLWGLNLHDPEDIARVCNISLQAATIRAERMEMLRKRGKFLTSPLERQVYKQFEDYIKNNRL